MPGGSPFRGIALIVVAIAVLSLHFIFQVTSEFGLTRTLTADVNRAHEVRAELRSLFADHIEAHGSVRGFVLTGDRAFLRPYEESRRRIPAKLEGLRRLAGTEGALAAGFPELVDLSNRRLALLDRKVGLARQGRRDEAIALMASGQVNRISMQMIAWAGRADQVRRDALRRQSAQSRETELTVYLLQALQVLLLIAVAWMIARTLEERRRTADRYRDLARRQAAIFDAAEDGMLILTPGGEIEALNQSAARMFGATQDFLVGRQAATLFAAGSPGVELVGEALEAQLEGEPGRVRELVGRRRDGTRFPADVAVSEVELADMTCYLAVVRDATLRKQVDRMKEEAVAR